MLYSSVLLILLLMLLLLGSLFILLIMTYSLEYEVRACLIQLLSSPGKKIKVRSIIKLMDTQILGDVLFFLIFCLADQIINVCSVSCECHS
jgi:hypothetical protein